MKVGIFGGTFNPIHRSHLYVVEECREKLGLDLVVLMPTYIPPHKVTDDLVAASHRYAMCQLAVEGVEGILVSDYEIAQEDTSYTYQTLEHLHKEHPQWELFLLMGSDMFLTIDQWKEPHRIFERAILCGVTREQGEHQQLVECQKRLEEQGARTVVVEVDPRPMSSTEIRRRIGIGEPVSECLNPKVLAYIGAEGLYKTSQKPLEAYRKLVEQELSPKRYLHSLCVAEQARALAPLFGVEADRAELAGLLHDYCKEMPVGFQWKYLTDHGILLDKETQDNPGVWHGMTASRYLKEELGVSDPEVLGAIRWHTTGREEMSPLELVIFLADYTSADRDYKDVEMVRGMLPHRPMGAVFEGIRFGLKAALKKRRALIPEAIAGYQYYLEKAKLEEETSEEL